ncbi:MAG: hypothetical protein LBI87_06915 [Candidatus Accumulibacter sp.]|jgi:hypothetical protein|nr:hypothetical protein [Accumulibacter sp.]
MKGFYKRNRKDDNPRWSGRFSGKFSEPAFLPERTATFDPAKAVTHAGMLPRFEVDSQVEQDLARRLPSRHRWRSMGAWQYRGPRHPERHYPADSKRQA